MNPENKLISTIIIVSAILVIIFAINLFYNDFFLTYLWAPIVNDSGYNLFSTTIYSIVVLISILLISKLYNNIHLEINLKFIYSLIPFLFTGSLWRVIEDLHAFDNSKLHNIFISPIIYFLIAFIVFLSNYIGNISKNIFEKGKKILSIIPIIVLLLSLALCEQYINLNNHIPALYHIVILSTLFFLLLGIIKYNKDNSIIRISIFITGVFTTFIGLAVLIQINLSKPVSQNQFNINIIIETIGYSLILLISLVWIVRIKWKRLFSIISQPLILFLIFSMFLDAFAAIYSYKMGYIAKHILTAFLFNYLDNSITILFVKSIILLFILFFLNRLESKKTSYNYEYNENPFYLLFIFTMITINFSPALRVITRIFLGI